MCRNHVKHLVTSYLLLAIVAAGSSCQSHNANKEWVRSTNHPKSFITQPISPVSLAHLREGFSNDEKWAGFPADSALEYLHWKLDVSERPNKAKLQITIEAVKNALVVTIIDDQLQDDSVYVMCDQLTMHQEGLGWVPIRHQSAWQGRGRVGWTTKPTN